MILELGSGQQSVAVLCGRGTLLLVLGGGHCEKCFCFWVELPQEARELLVAGLKVKDLSLEDFDVGFM